MNKLNQKLKDIQASQRPGFMMHIIAGYPDMECSAKIAEQLLSSGADILEIQIPFSDPVADGPVIAKANEDALEKGATVKGSFDMIESIANSTDNPIVIMTYFNIIHRYGVEAFCKKAASAGAQGLIVPDYPFDEEPGNELLAYSTQYALALIQVIASTTRLERIKQISQIGTGFVYCMARTGITGKKTTISAETTSYLERVKANCPLPVAVGFGLSERSQIEALEPYADIMIVGSALIWEYADLPLEIGLKNIIDFMNRLTGKQRSRV